MIGNLKTYYDGRLIVGVKYKQALFSAVGLGALFVIALPFYGMIAAAASKIGTLLFDIIFYISMALLVIQFVLMLLGLYFLLKAAFCDAGVIPGRELQEVFNSQLKDALQSK